VVAGLAWSAGCGRDAPAARRAGVVVRLVDHDGLMATVAGLRGKVVVLDCWSTSCPPCVREFPRLVALEERFGDDVACLSLSFDYEGIGAVDDVVPRVSGFLEEVGAGRIGNLLSREEADVLYRKLDLTSVPAVYVWKADGTLAQRFDEDDAVRRLGRPFTYDDVESLVRTLVSR
jgi:thiol-disulfide isomerase/thioredoxin